MNRVALVTGGGSGMGAAICRRFARDGMSVGVLDINDDAASSVAADINSSGGLAHAVRADISDRGQVDAAITEVRRTYGDITVLVNNAGFERFADFEDITDDDWDRLMDINLKGAYIVTQLVLPDMKKAQWGRIVNLSSFAAQASTPKMVDYTASKGGIAAMTKSLALALGPSGGHGQCDRAGVYLDAHVTAGCRAGRFSHAR